MKISVNSETWIRVGIRMPMTASDDPLEYMIADNAIADEENETLNSLAEGLGIDEDRAGELLDSVEADLAERPA